MVEPVQTYPTWDMPLLDVKTFWWHNSRQFPRNWYAHSKDFLHACYLDSVSLTCRTRAN